MNEKKKHWWTKLKEKWNDLCDEDKTILQCLLITGITGAVTGAGVTATVLNKKHAREMDELTQYACHESAIAYDTGVVDGATNPELVGRAKERLCILNDEM